MQAARVLLTTMLFVVLLAAITPASADSDTTVYVTSQNFEGGRMYYRSDSGLIWVFFYNGRVSSYPASSYSGLPDNPYYNPPPGRIRPIFGFGKVWGSVTDVRNRLGWATTHELGFRARIVTQGAITYLTELDGRIIQINTGGTWQYVSSVPQPSPGTPRIVRIDGSPNPVSAGGTLKVSWEVQGTETVIIEFYSTASPSVPFTLLQDLPLTGVSEVAVPATIQGDVRITIWAANRWHYYSPTPMYQRVIQQTITVGVQRSVDQTPYAQAAYQKYERGFMIWRGDTGAVIVFWGDQSGQVATYPENVYGALPDNPITYVPPGRVRSVSGFGKVWGNYQNVRDGLGYALGPEEAYTVSMQLSGTGSQSYRLPDGRWVHVNGSSWSY